MTPVWIWPVAVAPFVGSFLGVIVTRFERLPSVLIGRSACPACGAAVQARDLVPVLSWLALRGRCRRCGGSIPAFYPAIELAALGVAAWSAASASGWLVWAGCFLGWVLLALATIDFRHFVLPDFLTIPLLGAGLFVAWVRDPASLADHAIGAAAGFLFVAALRRIYWSMRGREGIGLGDAKLLAGAGAWLSWAGLPSVVLLASLSGLTVALLHRIRGGRLDLSDRVPFGTFLCVAIWIVWLFGPLRIGGM